MALPNRLRGFSLIELLVAAAVLAVLASVAMPVAELTVRREKEHRLRLALRDIRQAIDAYKAAAAAGKVAVKAGESGYPPRLEDLVEGVADASQPGGAKLYFMRRLPRDPLASDAGLPAAQTWGKRSYASPPEAPSEGDDVFDVYSLSTAKGLNGLPYGEW